MKSRTLLLGFVVVSGMDPGSANQTTISPTGANSEVGVTNSYGQSLNHSIANSYGESGRPRPSIDLGGPLPSRPLPVFEGTAEHPAERVEFPLNWDNEATTVPLEKLPEWAHDGQTVFTAWQRGDIRVTKDKTTREGLSVLRYFSKEGDVLLEQRFNISNGRRVFEAYPTPSTTPRGGVMWRGWEWDINNRPHWSGMLLFDISTARDANTLSNNTTVGGESAGMPTLPPPSITNEVN